MYVYGSQSVTIFTNCEIRSNAAAYFGGGVYVKGPATVNFDGCDLNQNTANDRGGAVDLEPPESGAAPLRVNFFDCNICRNEAVQTACYTPLRLLQLAFLVASHCSTYPNPGCCSVCRVGAWAQRRPR